MLKIKFSLFIFVFSFLSIFSQEKSINDYKYIIVPEQFEFQKSKDSHQINSLTKFLFNRDGYIAILSNETFPEDLAKNRCLALTAKLNNKSKMFSTKMNIDLVNCQQEVIFSTPLASTREKDYKNAYHEVIRKTFESIKALNYKYKPNDNVIGSINESEIDNVPMEVKVTPEVDQVVKTSPVEPKVAENVLSANKVANGYNLVDDSNNLLHELQETSVKNVYIVKGVDGILFKSKNKWILEYYLNNQYFKEELSIKF